jgi:alpha-ketoglutarate-dependent taurine dioxygenase
MNVEIQTLGRGPAAVLINRGNKSVLELPVSDVRRMFKEHGLLLFRGFQTTPDVLYPFAQKFSTRFSKGGARKNYKGFVEEVDVGVGPIDLHSENANSPFQPDVIWFCCGRPADQDGQTTFCDSIELWLALSEPTKQLFLTKKIKFTRTYLRPVWKDYFGSTTTVPVLKSVLDTFPGVTYRVNADESVYTEYLVSAVRQPKYRSDMAFCNSLLTPWSGHPMSFEDGEPISDDILREIRETSREITQDIPWEKGDLAMCDNSWILHGRRGFTDEQRQIFALLSWSNF